MTGFMSVFSQNISGLWLGHIANHGGKNLQITLPIAFEIKYDSVSNSISGTNRTISTGGIYSNSTIQGFFDKEKQYYYIEETEITETNYEWKDSVARNYFTLRFKKKNKDKISGECFCFNKEINPLCNERLVINLKRQSLKNKKK